MAASDIIENLSIMVAFAALVWWRRDDYPDQPAQSSELITLDLRPDPPPRTGTERVPILTPEQAKVAPLPLISALWYAGELSASEMVRLAGNLLERHFNSPALRRLAAETATTRRDLEDLAMRCFRELGTAAPLPYQEAADLLAHAVAARVCDGSLAPHRAALSMSRLHSWRLTGLAKDFVLLNSRYEEPLDWNVVADLRQIDAEVRDLCTAILNEELDRTRVERLLGRQ